MQGGGCVNRKPSRCRHQGTLPGQYHHMLDRSVTVCDAKVHLLV